MFKKEGHIDIRKTGLTRIKHGIINECISTQYEKQLGGGS